LGEIERVRKIVEQYFDIKDMHWTGNRVNFVCTLSPIKGKELETQFTKLRRELMPLGYIPRVQQNGAQRQELSLVLGELATTPLLKEMLGKIKREDEPEIRDAWVEEFFHKASCPQCSGPLNFTGRSVECRNCDYGKHKPKSDEYVIEIVKKPKFNTKGVEWNIALFILTIISTIATGAVIWASREHESPDAILRILVSPYYLSRGALFFSLPLMAILGTHEMGHYLMAKHHGIAASLPFFIPLPPGISIFGTMGAFISLREPMSDKKALFDIGIAGPIAGLLVAIPVTIIGIMLTTPSTNTPDPGEGPNLIIGVPLLYRWIAEAVPHEGGSIHPTAFAGWVGLFITALNLLPAGQLDGGHVARALLGDRAHYLSYATILAMVLMGFLFFTGWFLFAMLILLLGARHPPPLNDLSKLDKKRVVVGVVGLLILVTAFTATPMRPLEYDLHVEVIGGSERYINGTSEEDSYVIYILNITNPGDVDNTYDITNSTPAKGWNVTLDADNVTVEEEFGDEKPYKHVHIKVFPEDWSDLAPVTVVNITVRSQNKTLDNWGGEKVPKKTISFTTYATEIHRLLITPVLPSGEPSAGAQLSQDFDSGNTTRNYTIKLRNAGNFTEHVKVSWLFINTPVFSWQLEFFTRNESSNTSVVYIPGDVISLVNSSSTYLNVTLSFLSEDATENDTAQIDMSFYILSDYDPSTGEFETYTEKNMALVGRYVAG